MMEKQTEKALGSRNVEETSKEEKLIFCFRMLNEQGQDYILKTMDMVKDKYVKGQICFPTWRIAEEIGRPEA